MSRKTLIRSSCLPYHVTARVNNKECFHLPLETVWKVFDYHLFEIKLLFDVHIHAFVVMPNHIHLLITTPCEDLGIVMHTFIGSATRTINLKSGRSGRVFGARYHWTIIDSEVYFSHALKYVYRNPVKANLCEAVEQYQYSSLQGLLGFQHISFPLYFPFEKRAFEFTPKEIRDQLLWLNASFLPEHEREVSRTLKKTTFFPPQRGWKGPLRALHSELI